MSLRVGIVGAGDIAESAHLPAWAARDDARVAWIADADVERAQRVARQWDVPRAAATPEEAYAWDAVEAVDICTPSTAHAAQTRAALDRGLHVLVEKPIAPDLADVIDLAERARRHDGVVMVAENWPFSSVFRDVEHAVGAGMIGRPVQLQGSHESALRLTRPRGSGRGDRDQLGYFFTAGVHMVNLSIELCGDFRAVSAFATPAAAGTYGALDDDLVLCAQFVSGAIGAFNFTGRSLHLGPRRLLFRLIGEEGVCAFDIWGGWTEVTTAGTATRWHHQQPSMGYAEEIDHFLRCVREGREPRTSLPAQVQPIAVVTAGYRAVDAGVVQHVDDLLRQVSLGGPR